MPFLWEVSGISIYLSDVEFVTKVKSDNFVKYFQARVKFSRISGISIYLSDVEFVAKVKSDNFVKYFQARVKFSRISGISIYQRWPLVGKDDYLC